MKLYFAPASPYVRKVSVCAIEAGLDKRIERLTTDIYDPKSPVHDKNPLGRLPTLITDDTTVLFDSPVICEYLDAVGTGPVLVPPAGEARWSVLRTQALADGILDAAVLRLLETRRSANEQSKAWIEKQKTVIGRALDWLEKNAGSLEVSPTIGTITVAIAGDYLDFRFPGEDWRKGRAGLAAWHKRFAARPSMQETYPKDPS